MVGDIRGDMKSTARWRAGLLALCVLGLALVAHEMWVFSGELIATSGISPVGTAGRAYLQTIQITPNSAAQYAGLRSGEVIDLRPMSLFERYRLYSLKYRGETFRVFVLRNGQLSQISVVTRTTGWRWDWSLRFGVAGNIWMLLFGGLLAWKRADSVGARVLSLLLMLIIIAIAIAYTGDFITPWPAVDAAAHALWGVLQLAVPLLCVYAMLFAQPPSLARKVLAWLAYASASLSVAVVLAQVLGALAGTFFFFSTGFSIFASIVSALPWLFALSCGAATAVQTRGLERARFLWAFAPIALLYVAETSSSAAPFANAFWLQVINIALNAALFLAPLGLTYSLFSRRLLDIGFALNRAAVFSGVSVVIVGLFVLVEWLLSDWMQRVSHSTSIIVSGALALMLGLSIRFVHGKVEHVVDNVMFRKRREDEEAIRRMAREAPYITDRETLLYRVEQTLHLHAGASFVRLLLDDGNGRYGGVNENDPALVRLRAEHTRVDLHAMQTALDGEWAYPMAARGRLAGALVLGPKTSGESYAPDESSAIAQLAHSVAGALDAFDTKAQASDVKVMFAQILTAISGLSTPERADV